MGAELLSTYTHLESLSFTRITMSFLGEGMNSVHFGQLTLAEWLAAYTSTKARLVLWCYHRGKGWAC